MAIGTTNFPTALDTASTLVEATNNASSTLTGAITNSQNTIPIADPAEFPDSGFATIVDSLTSPTKLEIISYTGKSGSDLTGVTRGAQGTTGTAFDSGNFVELRYTKGMHEALRGAIIAVETKLGYGSDTAANGHVLIGNGAGTSEWRALIAGDIPDLSATYATAGHNHSGVYQPVDADLTAIAALSNDGFLKKTGGTWGMDATAYGTGTVTSVALSLPAILSVSGSPITTNGTFTVTLADQAANVVLAGPATGAATTPAFRALVAADIPGVLSVTKLSNLTSNGFVKTGSGDGTLSVDTATYLTANQTVTLSGDVTGSGATAITATIANDAVTYAKMQDVSATSRILGRKTALAGNVEECTLSEVLDFIGSAAQGDILYRGASGWARLGAGTNGHYLQTQGAGANPQWAAAAGGGGITIGTTAITSGTAGRILYETSGNVVGEIAGSSADANGAVQFATTARTATTAQYFRVNTPADLDLTNSEKVGIYIGGDGSGTTVTRNFVGGGGAIATQRETVFVAPTYDADAAQTITTAATVAITGAPVAGANATITTPLALSVGGRSEITLDNATTNASDILLDLQHSSSGTPAASFGAGIRFGLESTTTVNQDAAQINAVWAVATHASRKAALHLQAANSSGLQNGIGIFPESVPYVGAYAGGTNGWQLHSSISAGAATSGSSIALQSNYLRLNGGTLILSPTANNSGVAVYSNNLLVVNDDIGSPSTTQGQLYVKTGSASRVGLRVDSAATPSVDIVQFTNNGTNRWALNSSTTATTRTMTGPNGGANVVGALMENVTLSTSGTTTDSTIDLPANSIILSVTGRITTTITTATDWKLGDATISDRFSDANATLTSGTTTVGINQWKADRTTAGQGAFQQSTAKVRITTTGTPGAGAIRITIHYIQLTAPTS